MKKKIVLFAVHLRAKVIEKENFNEIIVISTILILLKQVSEIKQNICHW